MFPTQKLELRIMIDTKKLTSLIKEMAYYKNLKIDNEFIFENKKIENKATHAARYFGDDEDKTSNEINGKGGQATPGRGSKWSLKKKPSQADFVNSAFTHKDGRKLIPTATKPVQKTVKGKKIIHHEFRTSDGKTELHPISSVTVETKDTGKHNDEHALKNIWNHFTQNHGYAKHRDNIKRLVDTHGDDAHDHIVNYIHGHLEKAESDENHPLHVSKRNKTEFVHNIHGHDDPNVSDHVRERSRSSYHENMRNSALSFAALMKRKEFKKAYDDDFEMVPTGAKKAKLNANAKRFGMKDGTSSATYKSDVITLRRRGTTKPSEKKGVRIFNRQTEKPEDMDNETQTGVSVKKGGGSQIESPDAKGFNVLYAHAIDKHYGEKDDSSADRISHKRAHQMREEIAGHMERSESAEASAKLNDLHKRLDGLKRKTSFTRKVWKAGITGEHKFEGTEGRADTILVQGVASKKKGKANKSAKIMSADEYVNHLHEHGQLKVPEVSGSKHGGEGLALRMRVKD